MNHVLLLGAGFSRNWNGWLASEIMDDLLGRLGDDAELGNLLRRIGNFEEALSRFRETSDPSRAQRLRHDSIGFKPRFWIASEP